MRSKRFTVYVFQTEHNCEEDKQDCLIIRNTCLTGPKMIIPTPFSLMDKVIFEYMNSIPPYSNSKFFFLEINYPSSYPITKLINMDKPLKVRQVIKEFEKFYKEVYAVEQLTVEPETTAESCKKCIDENFNRFSTVKDSECSICTESVLGLKLDCGHTFDEECITEWFKKKNSCPLCRAPIKPCPCQGKREVILTTVPPLEVFFDFGIPTTGMYKLSPLAVSDLYFSSLMYDRENNVFKLNSYILM